MHYLGNASISNYICVYRPTNVIGAAIIAVAASTVALSLFFVFRASWNNSWWKRALSAVVLAGAVSGMHWCASTGTHYRLVHLNLDNSEASRRSTIIVVICLSISAASIMAGTAVYTAHVKRRYAHKAQQLVLAAAVFDKSGRILVNPDGLLPSEKITDTYIEKSSSDTFSVAHPLFHWMFQASRNWNGLDNIIGGITRHLAHLPRKGRDNEVRLIDEYGEPIQNYDTIFCELFCLAAVSLAEKTKEQLAEVGVLWDEILPTGAGGPLRRQTAAKEDELLEIDSFGRARKFSDDLMEKGAAGADRNQEYGRGSLMFLVRCVEQPQEVERLEAAGYRFADIHQVSGIIASSMQIKAIDFGGKLMNMAAYAGDDMMMEPGVHVGFFAIKARVGGLGFSVLVKKTARNLLPIVKMSLKRLESWQIDIIRQLDQTRVTALPEKLEALTMAESAREKLFASQLHNAIEALRTRIDDPIFAEATLTSRVVQIPCRTSADMDPEVSCSMIAFHILIPIHKAISSPEYEFIPLNFFKVHQMVYKDSPALAAFARFAHREMAPVVNALPVVDLPRPTYHHSKHGSRLDLPGNPLRRLGQREHWMHPADTINDSRTHMLKVWSRQSSHGTTHNNNEGKPDKSTGHRTNISKPSIFGGILVSQEIKVDVREEKSAPSPAAGSAVIESETVIEAVTFVDELLAVCVGGR